MNDQRVCAHKWQTAGTVTWWRLNPKIFSLSFKEGRTEKVSFKSCKQLVSPKVEAEIYLSDSLPFVLKKLDYRSSSPSKAKLPKKRQIQSTYLKLQKSRQVF